MSTGPAERPRRGVLFDFSGTLFHNEPAEHALLVALGPGFVDRAADLVRLGAVNGAPMPEELPEHLVQPWLRRDLSAEAHRAAYGGSARHAGLSDEQADALYERGVSAEAWAPYPDTVDTLRALHEAGVPVAVVSNIGWDPRPVLRRYGVLGDVAALVLSDERGLLKPDPEIFRAACAELDVAPAACVMVGDDERNDGGCRALGIALRLVPSAAADREPDALWRAAGLPARDPSGRLCG